MSTKRQLLGEIRRSRRGREIEDYETGALLNKLPDNPEAVSERKKLVGQHLLEALEMNCERFDRAEVRRLCSQRPCLNYRDHLERALKTYKTVLTATEDLPYVAEDKTTWEELARRAIERTQCTLDELTDFQLTRNDWLLAALVYYLEYFRLEGVDLYGSAMGLMVYCGGVPPVEFGIDMEDFDIFNQSEDRLSRLTGGSTRCSYYSQSESASFAFLTDRSPVRNKALRLAS